MALTQVFTAGNWPSATKLNESSIPVVSSVSDISAPYVGQIVFNTTDSRLWRCTSAGTPTWVVFTGGPTWSIYRNSAQSIANSTWTAVQFNAEAADPASVHDTGTNPDRVTVNQPGLYAVVGKGAYAPNATGLRAARLTKNGTVVDGSSVIVNNVGGTFDTAIPTPTIYVQCALNDILRVEVWQNSGGALNTSSASAGDYPLFTGTWLRD